MGIKDLFGIESNKSLVNDNKEQIESGDVESQDYVDAHVEVSNRVIPRIDFSSASNFARYGSAKKYYQDSIKYIYETYPYDGSQTERTLWHVSASNLDKWIFENRYPRSTGYLNLNSGSLTTDTAYTDGVKTIYTTTSPQYAKIKGGPNTDPDAETLKQMFPTNYVDRTAAKSPSTTAHAVKGYMGSANLFNTGSTDEYVRETNLSMTTSGSTVEFWAKFDTGSLDAGSSTDVGIFDLWNGTEFTTGGSGYAAGYARLGVSLTNPAGAGWQFSYTYMSGSDGLELQTIGGNLTTTGLSGTVSSWKNADWNHYALTFHNDAIKFYVNGELYETCPTWSDTLTDVDTADLRAAIGSFIYMPDQSVFSSHSTVSASLWQGVGPAPIQLDEVRYWKTARTHQQIGRNWFTNIAGGSDSDDYNSTLGAYYKFNEGISGYDTTDSVVLDYSGRISNGSITNYTSSIRSTGSAFDGRTDIVENSESKDPVMYSYHPDVVALYDEMTLSGTTHDHYNNSGIYNSVPSWITEMDEEKERHTLLDLTQVMASYFDDLQLQIQELPNIKNVGYGEIDKNDADYADGENADDPNPTYSGQSLGVQHPFTHANRLIRSAGIDVPDLFTEATAMEELLGKDEWRTYDRKLYEIKNLIYHNIYNNIVHIYKSKGTTRAFRNLLRCFGVDEELIKINLYADNVTYELGNAFRYSTVRKKYIDFNHADRYDGRVHPSS